MSHIDGPEPVIKHWECPECGRPRGDELVCRGGRAGPSHETREWVRVEYVRADLHRGAVDRIAELEHALTRVLPYVHAEPHSEHSALHDWARAHLEKVEPVGTTNDQGAVRAIGDAIGLLEGCRDGDAVDARALLKAAHAKYGGQ